MKRLINAFRNIPRYFAADGRVPESQMPHFLFYNLERASECCRIMIKLLNVTSTKQQYQSVIETVLDELNSHQ